MIAYDKAIRKPVVFIVDDERASRESLAFLLESVGLQVEAYPSAETFLGSLDPCRPGCLVADVRLPGISGIALQEELRRRQVALPIILITGYGEVSTAVRAMKSGAIDFIEKPITHQVLLESVRDALDRDCKRRRAETERELLLARYVQLTPREREIMGMMVTGTASKVIAYNLGISQKTVEVHRSHIMQKMQVGSLAELVRAEMVSSDGNRAVL